MAGGVSFFFRGGDVALDFANTRLGARDLLAGRLSAWLRAAGLPKGRGRGGGDAIRLRDAIRTGAESLAAGRAVPPAAAAEIDRILRANAGAFRLRGKGAALRLGFEPARPHPLAPVAEAAARLFTGSDRKLVRRCGNPACFLLFLDRTRNARRRWCSMTICGNRMKVAAWRARNR